MGWLVGGLEWFGDGMGWGWGCGKLGGWMGGWADGLVLVSESWVPRLQVRAALLVGSARPSWLLCEFCSPACLGAVIGWIRPQDCWGSGLYGLCWYVLDSSFFRIVMPFWLCRSELRRGRSREICAVVFAIVTFSSELALDVPFCSTPRHHLVLVDRIGICVEIR